MKRFLKKLVSLICSVVVLGAAVYFGPSVFIRFFGPGNTQWISEQFTHILQEKNELIVYEVETTGQETVSQDAWLIGTVQKVMLPYTFQMRFTVDLSKAVIDTYENEIVVSVPKPQAGYQKLVIDEEHMQKIDWLYPLTPERYAAIVSQVEMKLFENAAANPEFQKSAWDITVQNLESLFDSVADERFLGRNCTIQIVPLIETNEDAL